MALLNNNGGGGAIGRTRERCKTCHNRLNYVSCKATYNNEHSNKHTVYNINWHRDNA